MVPLRLDLRRNVNVNDESDVLNQILCVNYEHEYESVKEVVNVNPDLELAFRNKLFELYQHEYVLKERYTPNEIDPNLEMTIVLKHNQPISYRARRISYCDREKLRIILDDLLKYLCLFWFWFV